MQRLSSGAPWRDLPDDFGPYTTCYNRFVRCRWAGVWGRIVKRAGHRPDASGQMIDSLFSACIQHGACVTPNRKQSIGWRRGGLTSKIHALADTNVCRSARADSW